MNDGFEGQILTDIPDGITINRWLNSASLRQLKKTSSADFRVTTHTRYTCVEYLMRINLFTFGNFNLRIPMTVIGAPLSIDSPGYCGDLDYLIRDYEKRPGVFLILNLPEAPSSEQSFARGETLATAIFQNNYGSFEEYIASLRSNYRRRLRQAIVKGKNLQISKIPCSAFSEQLHSLYLQVLHRSHYQLETLSTEYFRNFEGDVHVFYLHDEPLAFVALAWQNNDLYFLFGGLDYSKLKEFDLYYNMLLLIIKEAIMHDAGAINFGQTAESTKQRLGCRMHKRYMIAFSGNPLINLALRLFGSLLEYKLPGEVYHSFRNP